MTRMTKNERILTRDIRMNNDTRITGINNNDLIVGPTGAGKTRGYVIPNLLQTNENIIIADTKGNLCRLYGGWLHKRGYEVMNLNFADTAHSPWGFNPLSLVKFSGDWDDINRGRAYSEQDIKRVAAAICPQQNAKDPFWDYAAQMYLECFISYVLNFLPEREHTLSTVYEMLTLMDSDAFVALMLETADTYPDSTFTRKFRMIHQNHTAEKMDASIKGILAQHLDVVSYDGSQHLFTAPEQITVDALTRGKCALFVTVSDSDRSQDDLVNLFYTQMFQGLLEYADSRRDSRLPIPVRFILDDFSTNTLIPNFDKLISVIRSREISVSLIVQSLSQLEGLYGAAAAQTIINNCDNCLYLGGQDVKTAEYFSEKMNKTVSTILSLPLDSAYLFTRGREPVKAEKYDLEENETYRQLNGGRNETEREDKNYVI